MEKLECMSCGAPIDPKRGICPYCGSRYRIDFDRPRPVPIMVENSHVKKLGAQICYSYDMVRTLTPDELSKLAIERLSHSMAEAIAGYMDIKPYRDYEHDCINVNGTLRVVPPDFRF